MKGRIFVFIAITATMALLPQFFIKEAYAGMVPAYNLNYTIGEGMMLLGVPLAAAVVVLIIWAFRAKQNQIAAK